MRRWCGGLLGASAALALVAACVGDDPITPNTTIIIVNDGGPAPPPTGTVPPAPPAKDAAGEDGAPGDAGTDAGPDPEADAGPLVDLLVFATSSVVSSPNFPGPGTANGICRSVANQVDAGAGAPFKAWLSTSTQNAITLLPANGRWHTAGGAVVGTRSQIAASKLQNPILSDEKGTALTQGAKAWTGTSMTGQYVDMKDCNGWEINVGSNFGVVGRLGSIDNKWTHSEEVPCNTPGLRLICFQVIP